MTGNSPVLHIASCPVLLPDTGTERFLKLGGKSDPVLKRRVELAAEDDVVYEETQGRECERGGMRREVGALA